MENNEMVMVAGGLVVPVELSFTCAECKILCHVDVRPEEDNTRCGFCWRQEQDRLAQGEDATDAELAEEMGVGLRNAWGEEDCDDDDYYEREEYEEDWEDPAVTYERERGEAFQDRVDMWRNEY